MSSAVIGPDRAYDLGMHVRRPSRLASSELVLSDLYGSVDAAMQLVFRSISKIECLLRVCIDRYQDRPPPVSRPLCSGAAAAADADAYAAVDRPPKSLFPGTVPLPCTPCTCVTREALTSLSLSLPAPVLEVATSTLSDAAPALPYGDQAPAEDGPGLGSLGAPWPATRDDGRTGATLRSVALVLVGIDGWAGL